MTTLKSMRPAEGTRAIILAGGKGVRLQPFTVNFPKPLVPLGDLPVVEVLIKRLLAYGIKDITMTLGHLSELIKAYFSHRAELVNRLNLTFVTEERPSGTAGSLAHVEGLTDTFLVMNGDLLTDLDFDDFVGHHKQSGAILTVATHPKHIKIDLGVIEVGAENEIVDYIEKPERSYQVSMGIYAYEPAVLEFIPRNEHLDFPELVLKLIKAGKRVCSYPAACQWLDIGRPDDYAKAQQLFSEKREEFENV